MTRCCPTCGGELTPDQRVVLETAQLRRWIEDEGVRLTAGRLLEADLARYLGKAPRTLRYWREHDRPLPFTRNGIRITYRVEDVAVYLVDGARW